MIKFSAQAKNPAPRRFSLTTRSFSKKKEPIKASHTKTRTAYPIHTDLLVYREGVIGGLIGAVGIAAWFLLADILQGRPFFTSSVLGATVLRGGGLTSPHLIPASFGMVMIFSVLHGAASVAIGAGIARLIREAGRSEGHRLGVNILLIFFVAWFIFMNMIVAGVVMGRCR